MAIHSMSIERTTDDDHVFVCSCGFESLPRPTPFDALNERCEVMAAEVEGARRRSLRKARERAWKFGVVSIATQGA